MVIDEHFSVNNISDLATYIERHTPKPHMIDIVEKGRAIVGYIDDCPFQILYKRGRAMTIFVNEGYDSYLNVLKKICQPVMWYKDPELQDDGFYAPMIQYCNDEIETLEWNYENPIQRLDEIMLNQKLNEEPIENFKIFYPGYDTEKYREKLLYGKYTGFFDDDLLRNLQTCNEIELYIVMENYFDAYDTTLEKEEQTGMDLTKELDAINYNIAYLAQLTKKFGVPMHEPTEEFELECPELYAWLMWWERSLTDMFEKDPTLEDRIFKGIVVNDRPSGSFYDLLPEAKAKFEEYEKEGRELAEKAVKDLIAIVPTKDGNATLKVYKGGKPDGEDEDDKNQ